MQDQSLGTIVQAGLRHLIQDVYAIDLSKKDQLLVVTIAEGANAKEIQSVQDMLEPLGQLTDMKIALVTSQMRIDAQPNINAHL